MYVSTCESEILFKQDVKHGCLRSATSSLQGQGYNDKKERYCNKENTCEIFRGPRNIDQLYCGI